jgi:hypothetical protein
VPDAILIFPVLVNPWQPIFIELLNRFVVEFVFPMIILAFSVVVVFEITTVLICEPFPMYMFCAFVVPILRSELLSIVEEFKTDTFVVPSIVVVLVTEPMFNEPVVKLSQILNADVELFACILFVYTVPVTT